MAYFFTLLYLFFLVVRPQEIFPKLQGLPVVMVTLVLCAVSMLALKQKRFNVPQNLFLLLLFIVIPVSGALNGWLVGGINDAMSFLSTIFLPFLILQNSLSTEKKLRVSWVLLVAFSMIMVHDGNMQLASGLGIGWSGASLSQGTRITYLGILSDPNDLGMFFVMLLPLSLYLYSYYKLIYKPIFLVSTLFLLQGIYLTNSRGALLGVLSQLGLWFYLKYGWKRIILLGSILLPILILVMNKFRTIDPEEASAEGRLEAWSVGIQLLKHNPLFGVGKGNFTDYNYLTAHNSFVLVFSELGILGYILWMGVLISSIYLSLMLWYPNVKHSVAQFIKPEYSVMARSLTFSLLGYVVTGFFLSRSYAAIYYMFAAMVVSLYYFIEYKDESKNIFIFKFSHFSSVLWKLVLASIVLIYIMVVLFL